MTTTRSVRLLLDGLHFGEGPRWHDGRLYLSDFYDHAVKAVTMDGEVNTVVEVPDQPSGLGWLPDGRMLVVSMIDRKVLRLEPDGLVEHADLSGSPRSTATTWSSTRTGGPTSGTSASTWTASSPSTVCGPRWASRVRRGRPSPGSTPTAACTKRHQACGSRTAPSSRRTARR